MASITDFLDENGLLCIEHMLDAGIKKDALYAFLDAYKYEKVGRGIYVAPGAWIDEEYVLSLRYPSIIFSHDEAFYHHGLIDHEPLQKTVTVYTGYGTGRLVESGIKVFTVKKELLAIGRILVKNNQGHEIPIYDLERTICDLLRSRSGIESQDFASVLKSYVSRKDKDLNKLMKYAKLFHVSNIAKQYLEVLL